MAENRTPEELGYSIVRIYTAARIVRPMIGKINGHKIPYGPYHIAQVIGAIIPVVLAFIVARVFSISMLYAIGVALPISAILVVALLPLARRSGVPLTHEVLRILRLIFIRRPIVVGDPEQIKRARQTIRSATRTAG